MCLQQAYPCAYAIRAVCPNLGLRRRSGSEEAQAILTYSKSKSAGRSVVCPKALLHLRAQSHLACVPEVCLWPQGLLHMRGRAQSSKHGRRQLQRRRCRGWALAACPELAGRGVCLTGGIGTGYGEETE